MHNIEIEQFYQDFASLPENVQTEIMRYTQVLKQKIGSTASLSAIDELNTGNLETMTVAEFKQQVRDMLKSQ